MQLFDNLNLLRILKHMDVLITRFFAKNMKLHKAKLV